MPALVLVDRTVVLVECRAELAGAVAARNKIHGIGLGTKMMTGEGPFGSVEMGGMFSMVKVRKDQKAGDYKDPGWYKHPAGTVAYEWKGVLPDPARFASEGGQSMNVQNMPARQVEVQVRKPVMNKGTGGGHESMKH